MSIWTWSTDFPNTSGGAQAISSNGTSTGSYYDGFVSRLNSSLTQIIQSTYLGGSKNDVVSALTIHPKTDDIYVAGHTYSPDFPKPNGGAQANYGGGDHDAFVTRLSADLAATASGGSGSGSGGGSSGSGSGSGSGSSSGTGSGSGSGYVPVSGGGGGCSMTGPASMAGWWNILTWLLAPTYVFARRIRGMK